MKLPGPLMRLYRAIAPDDMEGGGAFGWFEAGLLIVISIGLLVTQFAGSEPSFRWFFGEVLGVEMARGMGHPLYRLMVLLYWVAFCVIGYIVVPSIYLRATGRSIIDTGYLRFTGLTEHLGLYGLLFALVLGPVIVVSFFPSFQVIYPFHPQADRSWFDLVVWEVAYLVQFIALEFLFRGVMLEGLRRWLGYGAVFVMTIPYCMLHFQKAWPESLGSIAAGIILGCLAMKYRSIWGGVLVHGGVAVSMDLLCVLHKGELPTRLWPPGF